MFQNAFNQVGNILSGKPKDLTATSTSGSSKAEDYGTYGLDQYKALMERGVNKYGGPIVGNQVVNPAQRKQFEMLTGMQSKMPGAVNTAVGNMVPDQIGSMNRSGGPGAYAENRNKLLEDAARRRYADALAMGSNQVGFGAQGANAFGGSRHGMAEGMMGAKAMQDYMQQMGQLYADSYDKGMGWKHEDAIAQAANVDAMNRANLGFGGLRSNVAQADIANQFNLANQFGLYGQGQQQQQNLADRMRYDEFIRQQNWMPSMLNNYMANVSHSPWQQTSTKTGQGKSDLGNIMGMGVALGGAKLMGVCIPKGTTIDTYINDAIKQIPIEDIEPGMFVKGMLGEKTEVLQSHHYKENPNQNRFATVTFDNGSKVDCCDRHRINDKRMEDYKIGEKVGSHKIINITWYNGVNKSYDLLTDSKGYRINNIPVNSMIEELVEIAMELKKAA